MEVYQKAKEAAYRVLLESGISALPINIVRIAKLSGILTFKNSTAAMLRDGEAAAIFYDGAKWFIVYDDSIPCREQRIYVIAHETGRKILRHELLPLPQAVLPKRKYSFFDIPQEEKEAEAFARHLLAPLPVLREMGVTDSVSIARLCEIPIEAAESQAEILECYTSGAAPFNALEAQVYERFADFIESNRPQTGKIKKARAMRAAR